MTSQERPRESTPNLTQMVLMGFRPSVFTFYVDPKSKTAILPAWPLIGRHIFNFSKTTAGIYSKLGKNVSFYCPDQLLLLFMYIRNPIWPSWTLIG